MAIALNIGDLASRAIRKSAVGNSGVRRIAVNAAASTDREEGGVLGVYNAVNKFGRSLMSFALNKIGEFIKFSWSKFWGQVTTAVKFILNFDINITDKQIDEQIKQAEIAIAAAKGSLAGQSLGFAVCGLAPAATMAVFNLPLGLYVMNEVGEEAAEELASSLGALVRLQSQQSSRTAFYTSFKNHRNLYRGAAINFANLLVKANVLNADVVAKANKDRNKPFTIANALEESIELYKDPEDRAFWENLWDEFGESCVEAGFIVANSVDSYFAMQKMANQAQFGSEKIIEIQPIRDIDDEDNT